MCFWVLQIVSIKNGYFSSRLKQWVYLILVDQVYVSKEQTCHSFLAMLETKLAPWYKKMQDFRFTRGDAANIHFVKLCFEAVYQQSDGTPVGRLQELFGFLEQNLTICSFWTGCKHPILFIDEAHKMVNLTGTETDYKALYIIHANV